MPDQPWQHHLRNARVPWVAGMAARGEGWFDIARICDVDPVTGQPDLWEYRGYLAGPCAGHRMSDNDPWDHPDALPDPTDPATRYLLLAELARRVGLDPTWGVLWFRLDSRWWVEAGGEDGSAEPFDVDTEDPTLALCMALEQTAPKEET